ncbi:protein MLP1-like [Pseudomyrmex gracilis]|uniref:protein MLP1-like n=1 Tax=Pseudomyrmex gracilis TaxID=219809 RepID=UPI00099532F7|nr:protein MLP1-like [Pseudomyrmex gracilis]
MEKAASSEAEARSVHNEIDVGSESTQINSFIKQYVTLKQSLERSNRKVRRWESETCRLLNSNRNIEIKLDKLMQNVSDTNANISANVRDQSAKKQELRNFQSARADLSHKQWNNNLTEIGNYANDFSQWITEYSRNVLTRDIESHNEECKRVSKELELLKDELNDMRNEVDADCIQANVDIGDLPNITNIMSTIKMVNNNLMHSIRLAEDMLNKIDNKIRQSNAAIKEYKEKEKTDIF